MDDSEDPPPISGETSAGGSRFQIPQPNRDLQSNWELDLAKTLEEYLLSICSGQASPDSVNFAEAALLLQGSVQVYGRKVEYLYSLVLHALEFLSQKRQDQEKASVEPDGTRSDAVPDDEDDNFLNLDDVPVDAKNCLNDGLNRDDNPDHFVKPPANLLVLEGDCLDTSGDAGELDSYLLATCDFYRNFLLLDPCDAGAVHNFLESDPDVREQPADNKENSARSKSRQNIFTSPIGRSGGSAHKNVGQNQENDATAPSQPNHDHEFNNDNSWPGPSFDCHEDDPCHLEEPYVGDGRDDSDDDSDDPWKPLDPHESGNLKRKPFKKRKSLGRKAVRASKENVVASQFPAAKFDGIIGRNLAQSVEVQRYLRDKQGTCHSPPYYDKLRRSFLDEEPDVFGGLDNGNYNNEEPDAYDPPDFEPADFDIPEFDHQKFGDDGTNFDGADPVSQENFDSQTSLEDLCRSHLDSLLASIAETEKQTELAARVSTWKQRIEQNLEEQDKHPPFDIHQYGEKIMDKLINDEDSGGRMPFTDIVAGQPKHDVARTFSALLQLVNNGNIDLQKAGSSSELICHTASDPFHVKLLHSEKRKEMQISSSSKKRAKSPLKNGKSKHPMSELPSASKLLHRKGRATIKIGKGTTVTRCTPEGKRRRRSTVDLPTPG